MGWEQRYRRRTQEHPLDQKQCLHVAASLRASVGLYGVKLNPSAVLSRMIMVAERAGRKGVLVAQDDEQVRLLGQAQHVARCLEWFRGVKDQGQVVQWVKKSLDRIDQPGSVGLDHLFEIEIAGRLARGKMFSVATVEPDIVAASPAGPVGIACKHPDTVSGVANCIGDGATQVAKAGQLGIVIVSLDSVVHQSGRWLGVKKPDDAANWAADQATAIGQECQEAVNKAFAKSPAVVGVVLVLVVPFVSEGLPRKVGYHLGGRSESNPSVQGSAELVTAIVRLLYD